MYPDQLGLVLAVAAVVLLGLYVAVRAFFG